MQLYNATEMAEMFDFTKSSFSKWKKEGLPSYDSETDKKQQLYNPLEFVQWHVNNISTSKFKPIRSDEDDLSVEDQLRVKRMDKLDLDMAIQRGEYIPISEVDETTAGLVSLLINQLRQFMLVIPKKISKKTEIQIKKVLDKEIGTMIKNIEKRLNEENA